MAVWMQQGTRTITTRTMTRASPSTTKNEKSPKSGQEKTHPRLSQGPRNHALNEVSLNYVNRYLTAKKNTL